MLLKIDTLIGLLAQELDSSQETTFTAITCNLRASTPALFRPLRNCIDISSTGVRVPALHTVADYAVNILP